MNFSDYLELDRYALILSKLEDPVSYLQDKVIEEGIFDKVGGLFSRQEESPKVGYNDPSEKYDIALKALSNLHHLLSHPEFRGFKSATGHGRSVGDWIGSLVKGLEFDKHTIPKYEVQVDERGRKVHQYVTRGDRDQIRSSRQSAVDFSEKQKKSWQDKLKEKSPIGTQTISANSTVASGVKDVSTSFGMGSEFPKRPPMFKSGSDGKFRKAI